MELLTKYSFGQTTQIRVTERIFEGKDKHIAEVYNATMHDSPLVFEAETASELQHNLRVFSSFLKRHKKHVGILYGESNFIDKVQYVTNVDGILYRDYAPFALVAKVKKHIAIRKKIENRLLKAGFQNIEIEKRGVFGALFNLNTNKFRIVGSLDEIFETVEKFTKILIKLHGKVTEIRPETGGTIIVVFKNSEIRINPETDRDLLKSLKNKGYLQLRIFTIEPQERCRKNASLRLIQKKENIYQLQIF